MAKQKKLGDLKWGDLKKFNKYFGTQDKKGRDPIPDNMILSKNMRLRLNVYEENSEMNNNVFVIGGTDNERRSIYVKPNIFQRNMSYIVTDKAGMISNETAGLFKNSGYQVKTLNILDPDRSDCYNPFHYVTNDEEALNLASAVLASDNAGSYSLNVKRTLLSALVCYVASFVDDSNRSFKTVKKLLGEMEFGDANDNADTWFKNPADELDRKFAAVEKANSEHPAVKNYETFKIMAGPEKRSICTALKKILDDLTSGIIDKSEDRDTLGLDELGDSRQILYIIRPNTNMNAELPALLYTQAVQALCKRASDGSLRYPVHCIMTDFTETGRIYDFPRQLVTMKKYGISCSVLVQNINVVRNMYKDVWNTLMKNFVMQLYLGSDDKDTVDYINEQINDTIGKIAGTMTTMQLNDLEDDECIIIASKNEAYFDNKY